MSELRAQGRPRRGESEVGREKIISRLQAAFRCDMDVDLSRKTLAELAGVTPALITYYFPKKEVLLEAISRPVVCQYRAELERIVFGFAPNDAKLRDVVSLLVDLYRKDGALLDIYVCAMQKSGQAGDPWRCEETRMTGVLRDFLSSWTGSPPGDRLDAAVLQGAVWGMCRFAARIDGDEVDHEDDVSPLVFRVVQLLSPHTAPVLVS